MMDTTLQAFYDAVLNGTALDTSLPDRANAVVDTITSKLGQMGANEHALKGTVVPGGAFTELSVHLSAALNNVTANMSVYLNYTDLQIQTGSLNVQDSASALNQFFGSIIGDGDALLTNAQVAADALPGSYAAIMDVANAVEAMMDGERISYANALNHSTALSDAASLQAAIQDPITLVILDEVANGAVANAVDEYHAQQEQDFGWLFISDEDTPVSDDPTEWTGPNDADPVGPQAS